MDSHEGTSKKPERPDLLISVDFGMTCTGVGYINLSSGNKLVRTIQKWPGRAQASENKVPTVLVYPKGSDTPSSWGFKGEEKSEQFGKGRHYREWFKIFLDPARLEEERKKGQNALFSNMDDVEKFYKDYLSNLYKHIQQRLGTPVTGNSWSDVSIKFLFSVPSTWNLHTIRRFGAIAKDAGIGSEQKHEVSTGLTEAEAAAVFASTEEPMNFKESDIVLVCDAGGGTTDLTVLRVTDVLGEFIKLEQLDVVLGDTIGSAAIDQDFEAFASQKLSSIPNTTFSSTEAWQMMKSKEFQSVKCDFGSPSVAPLFSIPVPTYDADYTNEEYRIVNGELQFKHEDLKMMFDKQIGRMGHLVDKQLVQLREKHPFEEVSYVILSGGLGNSLYVQSELAKRYSGMNGRKIEFRVAPDPQLAVCKGLIIDAQRRLDSGKSVINTRRCRSSYGTMCRIEFDKSNSEHQDKARFKDKRDGKVYLKDAIEWFIKQGEPVEIGQSIKRHFKRKADPANPLRPFSTSIVKSDVSTDRLPIQMGPDAEILCTITAELSHVDQSKLKERNKGMFTMRKPYWEVNYEIQVIIDASDIRFELICHGRKLTESEIVTIDWFPPNTQSKPDEVEKEEPALDDGEPTSAHAKRSMEWLTRLGK